jgi:hypothetical protein
MTIRLLCDDAFTELFQHTKQIIDGCAEQCADADGGTGSQCGFGLTWQNESGAT